MVYFCVFDLPEKDKDTILKSTGKDNYKEVIKNMEYLDLNMAMATKFKRRMPEMTQDEFNEYLRLHS